MKNKSIETLQKEKCSGCSACYPVCPTNAITMEYDEEGFLYPIVCHEKCTNCGLCSKVCPELNFEFDNKKNSAMLRYAGVGRNKNEIVFGRNVYNTCRLYI